MTVNSAGGAGEQGRTQGVCRVSWAQVTAVVYTVCTTEKNTKIRLRSTWLTTLHRFGTQRSLHGRMHTRSRHVSQSPLGFLYRPAGCAMRLYAAGRCSLLPCRAVFESSNFVDKKLTYIIVLSIIICSSGRLGKITHHQIRDWFLVCQD